MKTIPVTPGNNSSGIGWVKPLKDLYMQLMADIEGLAQRINKPARPGVPACYKATRVFTPEFNNAFNIDSEQDGVSSNAVNYVVRDGQTYNIPIVFPGPGVFVARFIKVTVHERIFVPTFRGQATQDAFQYPSVTNIQTFVGTAPQWTTKFSLFPKQVQVLVDNFRLRSSINYFWNLVDSKSGRQLSDDLISHMALLPPTFTASSTSSPMSITQDGGLLELDVPWVFERDGQAQFLFRPITPVLQFDSSIAGTDAAMGNAFDDRQGNRRDHSVTVAVELHGYRYETDQDAMKLGAQVR